MWLRIFSEGPDRGTLLNVPEHLYRHPVPTALEGEVLALDRWERFLIGFVDEPGPCWLPGHRVEYQLYEAPPSPHLILIRTPDGRIIPTESAPAFGLGIITIPNWLAAHLEELTAYRLRLKRAERQADAEDKKRLEAEQRRRQAAATAAMLKRRGTLKS